MSERNVSRDGHELDGALSSSHGFLPKQTPQTSLGAAGFEPWDQLAADLPSHFLGGTLRGAVDQLPEFPADQLSAANMQRALTVLGLLAQSYHHCEASPPADGLPPRLDAAWRAVCARAKRPTPVMSYIDGIVNNWRLPGDGRDYAAADLTTWSSRLLVPTVDNPEERSFYLTQVAVLGQTAQLVEVTCQIEEAVLAGDIDRLKALLSEVRRVLVHVTREVFTAIELNVSSPRAIDHTVWTKTVASTFIPIHSGVVGPSGTSSPVIHLLDALFGRTDFAASHVSEETLALRRSFPVHWRDFLSAVESVPLLDFVTRCGDADLEGRLGQCLAAYAGDAGLLERHRLKAYGFLDTAFKIGRDATIGGYDQRVQPRTWDIIHEDLRRTRLERTLPYPASLLSPAATIQSATPAAAARPCPVHLVQLDISALGLSYRPGDRVKVRPIGSPALVRRALQALGATGEEEVALTAEWRRALSVWPEYGGQASPDRLPLRIVLRHAELRPVTRETVEALAARAPSETLRQIVVHHLHQSLELWDLFELARRECDGLTQAVIDDWIAADSSDEQALCHLVRPTTPRTYSVASAPDGAPGLPSTRLDLLIRDWTYDTASATTRTLPILAHTKPLTRRRGAASRFLVETGQGAEQRTEELFGRHDRLGERQLARGVVRALLHGEGLSDAEAERELDRHLGSGTFVDPDTLTRILTGRAADRSRSASAVIEIESPPHFRLPDDGDRPVVMFAAGSGMAPFRGFWQERAATADGVNLLYFSTQTPDQFFLRDELEEYERRGKLRTRVVFSRSATSAVFNPDRGQFDIGEGTPERIAKVLANEREASHLYRLLLPRDRGGLEGHFYICGSSGFARSVLHGLERIIARFHPGPRSSNDPSPESVIRKLVGEHRLHMDVHTTHTEASALPRLFLSDLCLRNCDHFGWWILVDGRVYDLTEFRLLHPGGARIIDNYAGLDATQAYRSVGHATDSAVHAMATMYEIGRIDPIVIDGRTEISDDQGRPLDLSPAVEAWTQALAFVTERENVLRNEYGLLDRDLGTAEPPRAIGLRAEQGIVSHAHVRTKAVKHIVEGLPDTLIRTSAALTSEEERASEIRETCASPRCSCGFAAWTSSSSQTSREPSGEGCSCSRA
jgi:sulfite reductase alpha subunit-like flavoprotein